jgi:translation initiation factor 2 beta subunit (eIF-2beta)/eIF-5
MRITINGQLTLMMLYEMLSEGIPNSIPLMQNTDGLEMMIPVEYKEKYIQICSEWEKITNLQLEHDEYSKMVIGDVNNYIAVNTAGKSKCKGRFEYKELALHKNKSHLIIPKALHAYFIENKLPEQFLQENKNILDYCAGVKIKGEWEFQQTCIIDREITRQTLQKTLRYYISNNGCKIYKVNKHDKREIQIESGKWMQTLFNVLVDKPWEEYNIDESYYLDKIYREINNILPKETKQLKLF